MQIYVQSRQPKGKSSSDSGESQRFRAGRGALEQHLFEHQLMNVVTSGAQNCVSPCIFAAFVPFAACGLQTTTLTASVQRAGTAGHRAGPLKCWEVRLNRGRVQHSFHH